MRRRVLFVDDEPRILEGIENLMFTHGADWDMAFALSGADALEIMRAEPVDVIVTDMRMPHTDGAELLIRVRDEYPATVRIALTGYCELEAAKRAIAVAHRFLSKPCDAPTLISAIEEALEFAANVVHGERFW